MQSAVKMQLLSLGCLQDFKIQNVVGSADVKFPVRLEGLAYAHNLFCSVRCPGCAVLVPVCEAEAESDLGCRRSTSQSSSPA